MAGHSPMLIVFAIPSARRRRSCCSPSPFLGRSPRPAAIIDIPLAFGIAVGVSIMATVSFGTRSSWR